MQFAYKDSPLDGIIRHIVNNDQQDAIKFDVSSNYSEETVPTKIFEYDESKRHWASNYSENSYFTIIFPFYIRLTNYSIRSSSTEINEGLGYLRKWSVKGSVNGRKWINIEDVGETDELSNYSISTRKVDCSMSFRHFKFSMKIANLDNYYIMRISNLELFGFVNPTSIRITCSLKRFSDICIPIISLVFTTEY